MTPPEPRTPEEAAALAARSAAAPNREDTATVRTVTLSETSIERIAAAVVAKLPPASTTTTPVTVATATATAVADAVVAKLTPAAPAPSATNPAATGST